MLKLVDFGTFAALPEEQISEKVSRRINSTTGVAGLTLGGGFDKVGQAREP